jgi:hypothetical protein
MWLFLNDAMLSIVSHSSSPGVLLVRARSGGDIERLFPGVEVAETPTADYRFRAHVPAETVADVLAARVLSIDYANFKGTVRDAGRLQAYQDVWQAMARYQERKHPRGD